MLRLLPPWVWFSFLLACSFGFAAGQGAMSAEIKEAPQRVVVIPIQSQIDEPTLFVLRRGLKEASENNVGLVVLDMKTPGGSAQAALDIMEALEKFPGKSITYINDEAVSAGAFIAAATDEIWFAPRAVIGAAAAVSSGGEDIPETMRLKITSFLRAKIRAFSEGHGYRGEVVSAMIDKDYELKIGDKVIKKPGELLSLTAEEAAAEYGTPPKPLLAAGVAKSLNELLDRQFGAGHYTVAHLQVTWSEKLGQYLSKISPVLMGLGMLALFIEFKTPGFGAFGIAGIILIGIVFLSNYVAGLSGHEPVLFFVLGLLLVIAELFFFPGLILPAITGLVLMLGSLVWAMADLWPNQPVEWSGDVFVRPLVSLVVGLLVAFATGLALIRFLPRGWIWDRMVLQSAIGGNAQERAALGESGVVRSADPLIGSSGTTVTGLFPSGQVEVSGRRYEARVAIGTLGPGIKVRVTGRTEFELIVEEAKS